MYAAQVTNDNNDYDHESMLMQYLSISQQMALKPTWQAIELVVNINIDYQNAQLQTVEATS